MEIYKDGYELKDDEYLLKIRINDDETQTGFLTKFNKNGSIPVAFDEWGMNPYRRDKKNKIQKIYIFKEEFRKGWKIKSWRFGQSQNWATMIHPEGFTVEIYLQQLLELIKEIEVVKGELIGEFKWEDKKLIYKTWITIEI